MTFLKPLLVLMIVALNVIFVSCSNDDDKSNEPTIVGTWELIKHEYNTYSNDISKDVVENGDGSTLTFKGDGTGISVYVSEDGVSENETFSWKQDGTKITVIYRSEDENEDEYTDTGEIQKLTDNELVIYSTHMDGDYSFYDRMTFRRK